MQEVSGTFYKNNFFLKSYGRIPTEFGTKRDKFQLKQTSIQLENDQRVLHRNEPSFSVMAMMNKKLIANHVE